MARGEHTIISLCLCVSLYLTTSNYLSLSICVSLSLFHCFTLSLCLCLPLFLYLTDDNTQASERVRSRGSLSFRSSLFCSSLFSSVLLSESLSTYVEVEIEGKGGRENSPKAERLHIGISVSFFLGPSLTL